MVVVLEISGTYRSHRPAQLARYSYYTVHSRQGSRMLLPPCPSRLSHVQGPANHQLAALLQGQKCFQRSLHHPHWCGGDCQAYECNSGGLNHSCAPESSRIQCPCSQRAASVSKVTPAEAAAKGPLRPSAFPLALHPCHPVSAGPLASCVLLSMVMWGHTAPKDRSSAGEGTPAAWHARTRSAGGLPSLLSTSWPSLFHKKPGPIQACQGLALAPQV